MNEIVNHSDWTAPIVAVPKGDGQIRICGDYKLTVNQSLDVEAYPLPKPEDLMMSLIGEKKFTKLDLSSAYQQMALTDESNKFLTISTDCRLGWPLHRPFFKRPWMRFSKGCPT